jgi:hypothetical protein
MGFDPDDQAASIPLGLGLLIPNPQTTQITPKKVWRVGVVPNPEQQMWTGPSSPEALGGWTSDSDSMYEPTEVYCPCQATVSHPSQ